MKCKKEYTVIGNKCLKKKSVTNILFGSKKNKLWDAKSIITIIVFFILWAVIFINSFTDLLDKYNIKYTMSFISWTAIIGVAIYWMFLLWIRRDLFP